MNKIGIEGNDVRQIVPAEFNFLSMADMQVVAALQGVVKSIYGLGDGQAVVVSGLTATWSNTETSDDQMVIRQTRRLTLGAGVVMWNGRLWDFSGGYIDGISRWAPLNGNDWVLVMSEQVVAPSPVYGATIALDVMPHKRTVCTLMSVEDATEAAQKVALGDVMRLGPIGEAIAVTERTYTIQPVVE